MILLFIFVLYRSHNKMSTDAKRKTEVHAPDMDPETAKVLFEQGAMVVMIGFPEGAEFGIDYNSWIVGPNFKGVKMIPAGIHFISYR